MDSENSMLIYESNKKTHSKGGSVSEKKMQLPCKAIPLHRSGSRLKSGG